MNLKFELDGITEEQKRFLDSPKLYLAIFILDDGSILPLKFKSLEAEKKELKTRRQVLPSNDEVAENV